MHIRSKTSAHSKLSKLLMVTTTAATETSIKDDKSQLSTGLRIRHRRSPLQKRALKIWQQDGYSSASRAKSILQRSYQLKPNQMDKLEN